MEETQIQTQTISGNDLRNLRIEKKLSQKDIAKKTGIHFVTINRAEKTNMVNQKTMLKIYNALQEN